MTKNMGTREYPEGVPHWSFKTLLAHRLTRGLQAPQYGYGEAMPHEFRKMSIPDTFPDIVKESIVHATERVDPFSHFVYVAFQEAPHEDCEGGYMLVNLLDGLEGGRVAVEEPFAGFIPDIALYAKDADNPSIVLEIVATSAPSPAKLKAMQDYGIEVYRIDVADSNPRSMLSSGGAIGVDALVTDRCGKSLRKEISMVWMAWEHSEHPFVGIRNYPSGTQEYLVGEHNPYDVEWHRGDPEVRGLTKILTTADVAPRVQPLLGSTRTISRELFTTYLTWVGCVCLQMAYARERECQDTPNGYIRLKQIENMLLEGSTALLRMVRVH